MTGELFRPFALTVTIALLASLLVALTIVPVLAYWFLAPQGATRRMAAAAAFVDEIPVTGSTPASRRRRGAGRRHDRIVREPTRPPVLGLRPTRRGRRPCRGVGSAQRRRRSRHDELEHPSRLQKGYLPIIRWTLKHAVVTIAHRRARARGHRGPHAVHEDELPRIERAEHASRSRRPSPVGTSLEAQDAASTDVEEALLDTEGVETVQLRSARRAARCATRSPVAAARITYSVTTDENADQDALQADVEDELADIDRRGRRGRRRGSSGFGASSDIEVDITASNQADLETATDAVLEQVERPRLDRAGAHRTSPRRGRTSASSSIARRPPRPATARSR